MLAAFLNAFKGSARHTDKIVGPVLMRDSGSPPSSTPRISAEQHVARGNLLLKGGRLDEAADCYRDAIAVEPDLGDAYLNLGFILVELGRFDQALRTLQRALEIKPTSHDAHYLAGMSYSRLGNLGASIRHFENAIAWKPDFVLAYRELGKAFCDTARNAEAKEVLRRGIAVDATFPDLYYFQGNVHAAEMEWDEAVDSYRKALDLQPDYASVHANMAVAQLNRCEYGAAMTASRKALALDPQMHHARSNLLVALSRSPECSPAEYLAEAKAYGRAVERTPVAATSGPLRDAAADPLRPLRVGFVSGDLRSHPVGFFLENVMAHWNDADMTAVAYSNHRSRDDLTARLQSRFERWRDVAGLSDEAAERQIRGDGIDVLVDLSGHTADNRLPLFARRPAPVQVTWLGYWASTGVAAIDYLLCDPVSVPSGDRDQFTETPWYLPETRLCFSPPVGAGALDAGEPPALRTGHVTFGSFQNLTKLNDAVLRLWARVIEAVPGSRLRVQSVQLRDPSVRGQLLRRLKQAGIGEASVQIADPGTRLQYLAAHAEVDIVLDTFPHGGATTTCEALWMGVPTVTIAGSTLLERQSASLLRCAGLSDWVARDSDEYVALAVRHAGDLEGLAHLRGRLRRQIEDSPLFDAPRFAAHLQAALRAMWRERVCSA